MFPINRDRTLIKFRRTIKFVLTTVELAARKKNMWVLRRYLNSRIQRAPRKRTCAEFKARPSEQRQCQRIFRAKTHGARKTIVCLIELSPVEVNEANRMLRAPVSGMLVREVARNPLRNFKIAGAPCLLGVQQLLVGRLKNVASLIHRGPATRGRAMRHMNRKKWQALYPQ